MNFSDLVFSMYCLKVVDKKKILRSSVGFFAFLAFRTQIPCFLLFVRLSSFLDLLSLLRFFRLTMILKGVMKCEHRR